MIEINIRSNVKEVQKRMNQLAYQQLPFATAKAVTELAKLVQADEKRNLEDTLDNPSPFTVNSVRVIPARKGSPVATVFVMDKAAKYLLPYETGGVHHLNSRALLNPKDIPLNQYGQLRRGALAALKARSDIYIGPIRTKSGVVNGVWQRSATKATVTTAKAGKQVIRQTKRGLNSSGALKLLIRFGDALPVKQRLHYRERAQRVVSKSFNPVLGRALARAIATAK